MRRVRTHKCSNSNPLAMFSAGVEQIISDRMSQQFKYDDQELRAMQRSPKRPACNGSLFDVLAQQLFWKNTDRQDLELPLPLKALIATSLKIVKMFTAIVFITTQSICRHMHFWRRRNRADNLVKKNWKLQKIKTWPRYGPNLNKPELARPIVGPLRGEL